MKVRGKDISGEVQSETAHSTIEQYHNSYQRTTRSTVHSKHQSNPRDSTNIHTRSFSSHPLFQYEDFHESAEATTAATATKKDNAAIAIIRLSLLAQPCL